MVDGRTVTDNNFRVCYFQRAIFCFQSCCHFICQPWASEWWVTLEAASVWTKRQVSLRSMVNQEGTISTVVISQQSEMCLLFHTSAPCISHWSPLSSLPSPEGSWDHKLDFNVLNCSLKGTVPLHRILKLLQLEKTFKIIKSNQCHKT